MKYSKYSLNQRSNKKTISMFDGKVGVFLTPDNKWLCKVKKKGKAVTLSQHKTEEEAQKAYDEFNTL